MARHDAAELAIRLGRQAEAVCRHYLSSGHRAGRYWVVGDVRNTKGRSMFVRLTGPESGRGAAGKFTDAATGEHGDLLDVIRETLGLVDFKDVAEEARRFLSLPHPEPQERPQNAHIRPAASRSPEASRRLFTMSQPISGTLADPAAQGVDIVAREARPMEMEYAISNGFGFGGVNASVIFRRWTDDMVDDFRSAEHA